MWEMSNIFISYNFSEPDSTIANQFYTELNKKYQIFLATESIRLGDNWSDKIDGAIENCDYFMVLLSHRSMESEMVTEEVRRAKKLRETRSEKKPVILPIRIQLPFNQDVNYELAGYLNRIQQKVWNSEEDTPIILKEIDEVISNGHEPAPVKKTVDKITIVDTEKPIPNAPLELELPEGKMSLQSKFYIKREREQSQINEILKPGALIRIKAPRQYGKTSLLSRILDFAKKNDHEVISLSFQQFDESVIADQNKLLRLLCAYVSKKLKLPQHVDNYWEDEFLGLKMKCSAYFEEHLLNNATKPIVLAFDEADRLFKYEEVSRDFFPMLRVWHEEAKDNQSWQKIKLIVTHSTEVNLSMEEINQSPFGNVGLDIQLKEFTFEQVKDLTNRHCLQLTDDQIVKIMDLIGGYPFLIRKALYGIAKKQISFNDFLHQAQTDVGLYGDHLRRHLAILKRSPELKDEMKFIIENGRSNELLCYHKLMAGGLVKGDSLNAKPSLELYRLYFENRI